MPETLLSFLLAFLGNQPTEPVPSCKRGWHQAEAMGWACIRGKDPSPRFLTACRDDWECLQGRCKRVGSALGRCER